MRGNVESCLRFITGCSGRWSEPFEAFWRQVDLLYRHCNIPTGVPTEHIPLWWARCVDQKIPVQRQPEAPAAPKATQRQPAAVGAN